MVALLVFLVGGILLLAVLVRLLRALQRIPEDPSRGPMIRSALKDAGLVVGIGAAIVVWSLWIPASRAPLLRAKSKDLPLTSVVPVTDLPLLEGRNVLWCASLPLAWDAFRRDVLGGGPLLLAPPACREAMTALNATPYPVADVAPGSFVALGGTVKSGIEERVREALRGRVDIDLPALGPDDAIAVGLLQADLPFETPFDSIEGGLPFGPEKRLVKAFGLAKDTEGPRRDALLAQVRIHLAEADGEGKALARLRPDRFIVELLPRGGKDRILLAQVRRGESLQATWEAVELAASGPGEEPPSDLVLKVPKIHFDIDHRFEEFSGARGSFGVLREVRQRTLFRLDETGARLESLAFLNMTLGIDPTFEFRRPFLIALVQRGATRPYFLLWVGNDELLAPE